MLRVVQKQDSLAVAGTANALGNSFNLEYLEAAAVEMKVTTTGVVDIDVYLEQSSKELLASEEGSSHAEYVQAEGSSKLADITDGNWHNFTISPISLKYGRLLFDGQGSNDAGNLVEWRLSKQERSGR